MIRLSILSFFITQIFFVQSQKLDQFYSSNFEPVELNHNSEQRFQELYKSYIKKYNENSLIDEERFVYEHNYFLDRLNKSGQIFYGDEISKYLNDLKDFILEGHSYKPKIKIYLTDFPYVNAFTNDFGNIYVNIASIAKLNSEEELLYLLAHEIGHVIKRHSHKSEIRVAEMRIERWRTGNENTAFSRHSFSREHEFESDLTAVSLLSGKVNIEFGINLLKGLESAANPVFSGPVDFKLLTGGDLDLHSAFGKLWNAINDSVLISNVEPLNNENSTHPTIELRIEKLIVLMKDSSVQADKYQPTGKFDIYKKLAARVLLNTYIESAMYISALDLVLKFRAEDPENIELIQNQINILTLLSQQAWNASEFDQIINEYGNACNDIDHLKFRKIILSITNEDLNIFAYRSIQNLSRQLPLQSINSSKDRLSYQIFFKNRPDLFIKNDSTTSYAYIGWNDSLSIDSEKTGLEEEDKEILDSLVQEGFLIANKSDSHLFLKSFIDNQSITAPEIKYILNFESKNSHHEITSEDFDFFQLPSVAFKKNFRGVFLKSSTFDNQAKTVLFQSDNFFLRSRSKIYFLFKYGQSLNLDSRMSKLTNTRSKYTLDLSNSSGTNISVRDNNIHKLMGIWINERSSRPVYSRVEDKLIPFLKSQNIKYIVYRICIANRNSGVGKMHYVNFYEVYYDVDTGEIAYLAKIASKKKIDDYRLENLIYLSDYNKNKRR